MLCCDALVGSIVRSAVLSNQKTELELAKLHTRIF
jgi:hypothetical protein